MNRITENSSSWILQNEDKFSYAYDKRNNIQGYNLCFAAHELYSSLSMKNTNRYLRT